MINNQNYEPKQNGKFRKKRVHFAQVSNIALRDKNLSLKAKGLYSLIQSYITLEDFELYKWYLMSLCKEGRDAFNSAWIELKENGYLKHYRVRGEDGRFYYEYDLLDEPDLSDINIDESDDSESETSEPAENKDFSPHTENPSPVKSVPEKPVPENPSPVNSVPENRGLYNNTDFINIIKNNIGGNNTQSVSQSGDGLQHIGQTDILKSLSQKIKDNDPKIQDETMEEIKERIEYDYFVRWRPEYLTLVDTLVDYMVEMVTAPYTKINGVMHSRESLKRYVDKVNSCTINSFIDHMKGKELRGIVNPIAYWRTAFINLIKEIELECATI